MTCGGLPRLRRSASRFCSTASAHSNMERVAGFGFPFLQDGFAGSSATNSAQENRDCCVSGVSSQSKLSTITSISNSVLVVPLGCPLTALGSVSVSASSACQPSSTSHDSESASAVSGGGIIPECGG